MDYFNGFKVLQRQMAFAIALVSFCGCVSPPNQAHHESGLLLTPTKVNLDERANAISVQSLDGQTALTVVTQSGKVVSWGRELIWVGVEASYQAFGPRLVNNFERAREILGLSPHSYCIIQTSGNLECNILQIVPPVTLFERFVEGSRICAYSGGNGMVYCLDRNAEMHPVPFLSALQSAWGSIEASKTITESTFAGVASDGTITASNALGCYPAQVYDPANISPEKEARLLAWTHDLPCSIKHKAKYVNQVCYVGTDGRLYCSGGNSFGQLGIGARSVPLEEPQEPFRPVKNITNAVKVVSLFTRSCAIDSRLDLWCWGENDYGQVGNGTHQDSASCNQPDCFGVYSPVKVLADALDVALADTFTCALQVDGNVSCWGKKEDIGPIGLGFE
jgi:hypothetical protein